MDGIIRQKKAAEPARMEEIKRKEAPEKIPEKKPEIELKTSAAIIKWEAPEYDYISKSANWFWSVAIISGGIAFASALLGNFLFAILVLIAGLTIFLYGARRPRKILFSFTSRGFMIENRLFPYENLKSFWIHYEPPYKKLLIIEPKKILMPAISVPLGNINPNEIRDHLLKFLKEERHEETFTQTISRLIGF